MPPLANPSDFELVAITSEHAEVSVRHRHLLIVLGVDECDPFVFAFKGNCKASLLLYGILERHVVGGFCCAAPRLFHPQRIDYSVQHDVAEPFSDSHRLHENLPVKGAGSDVGVDAPEL